ncbi:hypothetical protein [Rubrivirga sp. IMCC45206]|uniref:hypothetical protein n=1 Tax=Rubrivirga sp. IMCC45206 TaxID=3391614 RepID=UPI00399014A5
MRLALAVLFLVAVLGILLATQPANLENEVRLALPFVEADWTGPVLWMVAGWFGVGFGLGYLVGLPGRLGASLRARKVEKELTKTSVERQKAVSHLNEPAPPAPPTARGTTEADEMQRLADEVARRTESATQNPPPSSTL